MSVTKFQMVTLGMAIVVVMFNIAETQCALSIFQQYGLENEVKDGEYL